MSDSHPNWDLRTPDDPWGGIQPKFRTLARVDDRKYVLRGAHGVTGESVEVPIAGGVTFRMLRMRPRRKPFEER